MGGAPCVSLSNIPPIFLILLTLCWIDTATVDYDSRIQARHIFRLASMTEKPISAA